MGAVSRPNTIRYVQPTQPHYAATHLQAPVDQYKVHFPLTEEDPARHQQGVENVQVHQPKAEGPVSDVQKGTPEMVKEKPKPKKKPKKPRKPRKKKPKKAKKPKKKGKKGVRWAEDLPDYLRPLKLF
jgi:outer membrane biosynthesis protein TonB